MAKVGFSETSSVCSIAVAGCTGKKEVAHLVAASLAYDASCYFCEDGKPLPEKTGQQADYSLHVIENEVPEGLRADIAVITSVEVDNRTSLKLVSQMRANATVIIADTFGSSGRIIKLAEDNNLNIIRVNLRQPAEDCVDKDVWADRQIQQADCSCVMANVAGERVAYKISLPGEQSIVNSLLALAVIKVAGGDLAMAAVNFASQKAQSGHGLDIKLGEASRGFELVDYSSDMNAFSLAAALDHISLIETEKYNHRIAVLSDFDDKKIIDKIQLETLEKKIRKSGITRVLTSGHMIAKITRSAGILSEEFSSNAVLQKHLQSMTQYGDLVFVMGSASAGFSKIIEGLTERFKSNEGDLKVAAE